MLCPSNSCFYLFFFLLYTPAVHQKSKRVNRMDLQCDKTTLVVIVLSSKFFFFDTANRPVTFYLSPRFVYKKVQQCNVSKKWMDRRRLFWTKNMSNVEIIIRFWIRMEYLAMFTSKQRRWPVARQVTWALQRWPSKKSPWIWRHRGNNTKERRREYFSRDYPYPDREKSTSQTAAEVADS